MSTILFVLALMFVLGTGYLNPYWKSSYGRPALIIALILAGLSLVLLGNSGLVFRGMGIRISRWTMALIVFGVSYNIAASARFIHASFKNRNVPKLPY